MKILILRCGYMLHEESEYWEVERFTRDVRRMFMMQKHLVRVRKGRWIDVVRDYWEAYDGLWKDGTDENKRKRAQIETFKLKWWNDELNEIQEAVPVLRDIERRSVWEQ